MTASFRPMIFDSKPVLLQSQIRSRGIFPLQHEVSESLRTLEASTYTRVKGFWIQYFPFVLTGRCWKNMFEWLLTTKGVAFCKIALCYDEQSVLDEHIAYSLEHIKFTSMSVISLFPDIVSVKLFFKLPLFKPNTVVVPQRCTVGKSHMSLFMSRNKYQTAWREQLHSVWLFKEFHCILLNYVTIYSQGLLELWGYVQGIPTHGFTQRLQKLTWVSPIKQLNRQNVWCFFLREEIRADWFLKAMTYAPNGLSLGVLSSTVKPMQCHLNLAKRRVPTLVISLYS